MEQPNEAPSDGRLRLPKGTVLASLYEVEAELGAGGFGITYRGRDRDIGRLVAIKEYFPVDFSVRDEAKTVRPTSMTQRAIFEWGIKSFLREAKLLASFSHQGIVGVLRHFEENGTAYMVLDHVPGSALRDWPDRLGRRPKPDEVDRIAKGLCDALKVVHDRRLVHCDIAPDNIIVRPDGNPVLLDFGAARFELAEQSRILSHGMGTTGTYAVVKPHYSPLEQHAQDKASRGPWSDVYSLGATLYHLVSSQKPADVILRVTAATDPLTPAVDVARGSYRQTLLAAIDAALRLRHAERPQSVAEFERLAFSEPVRERPKPAQPPPKPADAPVNVVRPAKPVSYSDLPNHRSPPPATRSRRLAPVAAAIAACLALIAGGAALIHYKPWDPQPTPSVQAWIVLRDTAAVEVRSAGDMLTKATSSIQRSDWRSAKQEATEAERRISSARGTVGRLQSTAERGEDRRTASHYKDQLDQMAQTLSSIRRNIELGERPAAPSTPPVNATPVQPVPVTPPAPRAPAVTFWRHNGSTMRLVSDGQRRQIFYETPTPLMEGAGARQGTLLFDGERRGDTYTGTARLFSSVCGVNTYQVTGTVSPDQRRVELRGQARRLDRNTCQPTAPFEDVLVFELIEGTGQAPAVRDFALQLRPGNWAAQVGAFSTEAAAGQRIGEVRELFSETLRPIRSAISNEAHGTATLYKARFVGLDEASVRTLCAEIGKVMGADTCFPVPGGR